MRLHSRALTVAILCATLLVHVALCEETMLACAKMQCGACEGPVNRFSASIVVPSDPVDISQTVYAGFWMGIATYAEYGDELLQAVLSYDYAQSGWAVFFGVEMPHTKQPWRRSQLMAVSAGEMLNISFENMEMTTGKIWSEKTGDTLIFHANNSESLVVPLFGMVRTPSSCAALPASSNFTFSNIRFNRRHAFGWYFSSSDICDTKIHSNDHGDELVIRWDTQGSVTGDSTAYSGTSSTTTTSSTGVASSSPSTTLSGNFNSRTTRTTGYSTTSGPSVSSTTTKAPSTKHNTVPTRNSKFAVQVAEVRSSGGARRVENEAQTDAVKSAPKRWQRKDN